MLKRLAARALRFLAEHLDRIAWLFADWSLKLIDVPIPYEVVDDAPPGPEHRPDFAGAFADPRPEPRPDFAGAFADPRPERGVHFASGCVGGRNGGDICNVCGGSGCP